MDTALILENMLLNDHFSAWLGLVVDEYTDGYCRLHFTVKREMLNGFGIVHGGVIFSAADSAFAFACNSKGNITVALNVHISFIKTATEGDLITVEAKQVSIGNKIGFYEVNVKKESDTLLAIFNGTAYQTHKELLSDGL